MAISIHALLAESDTTLCPVFSTSSRISIHALLAESDLAPGARVGRGTYFYPRSPCGERPGCRRLPGGRGDFYPRSPCGERPEPQPDAGHRQDFYPRSPCGERPYGCYVALHEPRISIHALLAESDG